MKDKRPINLDLTTIKFPIPAIASILHRISGVALFLFIPFLLWLLDAVLLSEESFFQLQRTLSSPLNKFILWVLLASLIYHLLAGIRHLLMDLHVGETLQGGRLSAKIVIIAAGVLTLLAGVWLW